MNPDFARLVPIARKCWCWVMRPEMDTPTQTGRADV